MNALLPARYARWRQTRLGQITERLECELILEMAGPLEGRRALDVGCGDGTYALAAARRGARVSGVDRSLPMLEAARKRAEELGLRVARVAGDARSLPFGREIFDVVFAVTVLCFVEDAARAVGEMARVLKPGGRIVVGELGRWSLWAASRRLRGWLGSRTWRRARFRSAAELERLLGAAGLVTARVEGAVYYPPMASAARWMAPVDPRLRRLTTWGAAFVAVAAHKPIEARE